MAIFSFLRDFLLVCAVLLPVLFHSYHVASLPGNVADLAVADEHSGGVVLAEPALPVVDVLGYSASVQERHCAVSVLPHDALLAVEEEVWPVCSDNRNNRGSYNSNSTHSADKSRNSHHKPYTTRHKTIMSKWRQ